MSIQTKNLTYEEFLKLPEMKRRYEVVNGELIYMTPSPTPSHQMISRTLFRVLDHFVADRELGEVLYAPLDILIQQNPLRTRQPDLLFISKERLAIVGEHMIEGGPDLIVEILSPANTRLDLEEKLKDYGSINVRECWFVSPEAQTVEVLKFTSGRFERIGLYGLGDVITSEVLPGLHLKVEGALGQK
ncbi:MAG: Uma2 family endonuclease [candidate division NC10 bacterium]|nr:Uma2 family endonuclease [candidate division NC10 bacterium]